MRQTREYRISQRRVSQPNLGKLGELFVEQGQLAEKAGHAYRLRLQISCDDGTTYESDGLDVVQSDSEALLKNPTAVSFTFNDHASDRRVSFEVQHGDGSFNRLKIEGEDRTWVESLFTRGKELVESFEPSDSWFTRHRGLTALGAIAGLGSIVWLVLNLLIAVLFTVVGTPRVNLSTTVQLLTGVPFLLTLAWLSRLGMGAYPWAKLGPKFWEAWPNIELAFGPRHLRLAERRRRTLAYVGTTVVLPLIAALLYDVLTVLL